MPDSSPRKKSTQLASAAAPLEPLQHQLEAQLAKQFPQQTLAGQRILLAYSGGLDSRVLLELLVRARGRFPFRLEAMHVHHGLSPHADVWAIFCRDSCAALQVPLQVVHVAVPRDSGLGIEATARAARYQALLQADADCIVLAHHQDDQAETLLLQLLRGAGAKGLSAMAVYDTSRRLLRPLLHSSRNDIAAYAAKHGLHWVEDESNDNLDYERNFYRHRVLPLLTARFPAAKTTLARSAAHMAETATLLDALASVDAEHHLQHNQLQVDGLASLSDARARNLLRWWLAENHQPLPSSQRLQEMLRQLLGAKPDASIKLAVDSAQGVWLRRYRGAVFLETHTVHLPIALVWQGEAELRLPDNSRLVFQHTPGQGLAITRLQIDKLRITHRVGGERFKPALDKPTRTLKHLLQEASIPPWQRERIPLIYRDDALAVVPGIGVACTLQAAAHESGLTVLWEQA